MSGLVKVQNAIDELGIDAEDFKEFTEDLQEFLDEALPQLKEATSSVDFSEIKEKGHAIKGALANLRFVAAAEIAFELEKAGMDENSDDLTGKYERLVECLTQSFAEIA